MAKKKRSAGAEMPRHSKAELLGSKRFSGERDLLEALLGDKREYTIPEAEQIMDRFMRKGVD